MHKIHIFEKWLQTKHFLCRFVLKGDYFVLSIYLNYRRQKGRVELFVLFPFHFSCDPCAALSSCQCAVSIQLRENCWCLLHIPGPIQCSPMEKREYIISLCHYSQRIPYLWDIEFTFPTFFCALVLRMRRRLHSSFVK